MFSNNNCLDNKQVVRVTQFRKYNGKMRLRAISIVSNYNYIETFVRWAEASKMPSAVIYQNTVENPLIF